MQINWRSQLVTWFLFAARQRVQRNVIILSLAEPSSWVSIRCSTASTAERRRHDLRRLVAVSIRCSTASTAEPAVTVGTLVAALGFYSLLDSEYSGTSRTRTGSSSRSSVSIRCSTASTAEPPLPAGSPGRSGFYSLLDSEYSGTTLASVLGTVCSFLFAARQRVQRNTGPFTWGDSVSVVSIRCSTASTAERQGGGGHAAAVLGVSIRCSTASTAELRPHGGHRVGVPFLFAARQRVQRNQWHRPAGGHHEGVSIRCSTASTAEHLVAEAAGYIPATFLFAARQRVQRNDGVVLTDAGKQALTFLFAARQRVQRNAAGAGRTHPHRHVSIRCSTASTAERGPRALRRPSRPRFYSLLDSEYSGTLPPRTGL